MSKHPLAGALLLYGLTLSATAPTWAVDAKRMEFGKLPDGTSVEAVELSNAHGVTPRIIAPGAALQSLTAPDRNGTIADIVLGFGSAAGYLDNPENFGVTVGRFANRIAAGQFTLDGRRFELEKNNGPNHLHGGSHGLAKVIWKIDSVAGGSPARAVLSHVSPDGEGGYPGTLKVTASFSLSEQNELTIEYRATTDRPTIVNLTHHSYFNLAGEASDADVLNHHLTLAADYFTPVGPTMIPTGERRRVAGTAFDFRGGQTVGHRIRDAHDEQIRFGHGYDHNYVVNGAPGTLRPAARVAEPQSGRVLELLTTAPGLQFYSANYLDGTIVGKSGRAYRQSDALCLEPQAFPDAPNHPEFPSARLNPGQTYVNTIVFRFSVAKP
jgi:aldose 1-epimerase